MSYDVFTERMGFFLSGVLVGVCLLVTMLILTGQTPPNAIDPGYDRKFKCGKEQVVKVGDKHVKGRACKAVAK